jgi:hydrogenase expression/formation protein HypC
MCLAIPSRIVELRGDEAVVEVDGVKRACNVALIREPRAGDYVLLHAGFAIQKWSESDVREYQSIMQEINALP